MTRRTALTTSAFLATVCLLPALPVRAAAEEYKVDPIHSSIIFRVKHLGVGYIYGRFNDMAGTVALDEKAPAGLTLDIQVKADELDTNNGKRDKHLRGPDFFNTKEFPTISFKSKQVKLIKEHKYEVTGDLTLHGVTKQVTVELRHVGAGKDPFGMQRTGFETYFSIRRSDFGMNFMPQAIGDDVWLMVGFEAVRK
jgi:polyisoprenoid-binding protein YceI